MTYTDSISLTDALGKKLYTFAGHRVDATHCSRMWSTIIRGCAWLSKNPSAVSLNYDGSIYVNGRELPVTLMIGGSDPDSEMTCIISLNH